MKQLFKLVNQYAPLKYKAFLTLEVYSGFWNGELMGLERKEADWENNVISVRRTSNYTVIIQIHRKPKARYVLSNNRSRCFMSFQP